MAGDDDLLDPSEIEALLAQANGGQAPVPPAASKPASGAPADPPAPKPVATGSAGAGAGNSPGRSSPGPSDSATTSQRTEHLLSQAEANLAAALAPNLMGQGGKQQDMSGAAALQLRELAQSLGAEERAELSMLQDVELDLRIELGRSELLIEEVVALKSGSVVPLDKLAGDPVDILVNGRLIARGEVLVLNDNFYVRVAEILTPRE